MAAAVRQMESMVLFRLALFQQCNRVSSFGPVSSYLYVWVQYVRSKSIQVVINNTENGEQIITY